jgi:hypothetical protein
LGIRRTIPKYNKALLLFLAYCILIIGFLAYGTYQYSQIGGLGALIDPILIILNLVFFLGFPIFMLIASIPSLILLDLIRERRIRFARNAAKELGKKSDQQ